MDDERKCYILYVLSIEGNRHHRISVDNVRIILFLFIKKSLIKILFDVKKKLSINMYSVYIYFFLQAINIISIKNNISENSLQQFQSLWNIINSFYSVKHSWTVKSEGVQSRNVCCRSCLYKITFNSGGESGQEQSQRDKHQRGRLKRYYIKGSL